MKLFKDLYNYRELLKSNVKKEIRGIPGVGNKGRLREARGISWHIELVPLIAVIQFLFTLGLVFILSAINIYIQDTEYIVTFILNMIFYATPILYTSSQLPAKFAFLLNLNPLTHILTAYRNTFMYHILPGVKSILVLIIISILVCVIGYKIFKKLERGFAEQV